MPRPLRLRVSWRSLVHNQRNFERVDRYPSVETSSRSNRQDDLYFFHHAGARGDRPRSGPRWLPHRDHHLNGRCEVCHRAKGSNKWKHHRRVRLLAPSLPVLPSLGGPGPRKY